MKFLRAALNKLIFYDIMKQYKLSWVFSSGSSFARTASSSVVFTEIICFLYRPIIFCLCFLSICHSSIMKLFVAFFIICCLNLSLINAIEWPKFDLGMMLNKDILGKETVRAPAVPGQLQTQTITYNSVRSLTISINRIEILIKISFSSNSQPVPIDHIKHMNHADHKVKVDIVYNDASRKSATLTVQAPKGKDIDSKFVVFQKSKNKDEWSK